MSFLATSDSICREKIRSNPYHQFRGEMQCVRGASTVSKKNDLAARPQGRGGFLCELRDSADQFIGKALFDASAFLKLAANFFGRRGHRCTSAVPTHSNGLLTHSA